MNSNKSLHFAPALDRPLPLTETRSWPEAVHRFDEPSVWAVNAALAAGRPLLIRGKPGLGKSQLARAVAEALERPFLSYVVNSRCECTDLLYRYDPVSRLAQAQVLSKPGSPANWKTAMKIEHFVTPGVLWWALNWGSASNQAKAAKSGEPERLQKSRWEKGCVVLIDEIDKADSEFPNGLLESLGNLGFDVPLLGTSVSRDSKVPPPLVVLTTNEDRELPAAFLRRCLVLPMKLPEKPIDFVIQRGEDHFKDEIAPKVYRRVAEIWNAARETAKQNQAPAPGPSEYLDILRVLAKLYPKDEGAQSDAIERVSPFALVKNAPSEA